MHINSEAEPYIPHTRAAEVFGSEFDEFRSQIERYGILDRLHIIQATINREAGRLVLDELMYLQPQEILCVYIVETKGLAYQMALTLRLAGPRMVFSWSERKKGSAWGRIRRLIQHCGKQSGGAIKYELQFSAATVNSGDMRGWFNYLVSGFHNSLKPTTKNRQIPKND